MVGSQFKSAFAFEMFGWRCLGSSCGKGLLLILDFEPVSSSTFSASSKIVNSFGFPRLGRPCVRILFIHEAHQAAHQIVHKTERPGLAAIAKNGDRLITQRLYDEVRTRRGRHSDASADHKY